MEIMDSAVLFDSTGDSIKLGQIVEYGKKTHRATPMYINLDNYCSRQTALAASVLCSTKHAKQITFDASASVKTSKAFKFMADSQRVYDCHNVSIKRAELTSSELTKLVEKMIQKNPEFIERRFILPNKKFGVVMALLRADTCDYHYGDSGSVAFIGDDYKSSLRSAFKKIFNKVTYGFQLQSFFLAGWSNRVKPVYEYYQFYRDLNKVKGDEIWPDEERFKSVLKSKPASMADFKREDYIDGGSHGQVCRGERICDHQPCALKEILLPFNTAEMTKFNKMIEREVGALKKLSSSRYIVQYYSDFKFTGERNLKYHCIVTELCIEDLSKVIERIRQSQRKKFTVDEIWHYFIGMALALYDTHSSGIVHRDLKPNNFLVTIDGGRLVIKLADFGLAKEASSLSGNHTAAGAMYFKSPEKLNGELFGKRSDVWALGCILYELCTLQHPFHSKTKAEFAIMDDIRASKYHRLTNTDVDDSDLLKIIKECLNPISSQRPFIGRVLQMIPADRLQAYDADMFDKLQNRTIMDDEKDADEEFPSEPDFT